MVGIAPVGAVNVARGLFRYDPVAANHVIGSLVAYVGRFRHVIKYGRCPRRVNGITV